MTNYLPLMVIVVVGVVGLLDPAYFFTWAMSLLLFVAAVVIPVALFSPRKPDEPQDVVPAPDHDSDHSDRSQEHTRDADDLPQLESRRSRLS